MRQNLPLHPREGRGVLDLQQGQPELLPRLVVVVGGGDALQDAHEEGRAAREAGAAADVEEGDRVACASLLLDVPADRAGGVEEVVGVGEFHGPDGDPHGVAVVHHGILGLEGVRVIAVVEHELPHVRGGGQGGNQAVGPPTEGAEDDVHGATVVW